MYPTINEFDSANNILKGEFLENASFINLLLAKTSGGFNFSNFESSKIKFNMAFESVFFAGLILIEPKWVLTFKIKLIMFKLIKI